MDDEVPLFKIKDRAFHDALVQLFKDNPISPAAHEMHHAIRESALRKAGNGGYRDRWKSGNLYWRVEVENMATEWHVPPEQVAAVHLLIYGD